MKLEEAIKIEVQSEIKRQINESFLGTTVKIIGASVGALAVAYGIAASNLHLVLSGIPGIVAGAPYFALASLVIGGGYVIGQLINTVGLRKDFDKLEKIAQARDEEMKRIAKISSNDRESAVMVSESEKIFKLTRDMKQLGEKLSRTLHKKGLGGYGVSPTEEKALRDMVEAAKAGTLLGGKR